MSAYAAQLISVSDGLDVIYAVLGPVSSSGTTPSCRLCCLAPIQGENGLETETRWSQDIANSSLQWSIFRCSESSPGHLVLVGHDDGCVYSFSLQSNQLSQLCVLKGGVLTAAWEENSKFISLISRETGAISTVGLSELP